MYYFIAPLLLIAPISVSTQNEGSSVSQSNKPSNAHERKVTPPAVSKATQSKADEPVVHYNQSYCEDTSKPAHDAIDLLNVLSTIPRWSLSHSGNPFIRRVE